MNNLFRIETDELEAENTVLRLNVFNNADVGANVTIQLLSNEPEDMKDTVNVWFPESKIHVYVKGNT